MGQGIGRRGFPQMGQRQFGNPATDRFQNPKPFAGPKPGQGKFPPTVGAGMGGIGAGGGLQGGMGGQPQGGGDFVLGSGFGNRLGEMRGMGGLLPQQGGQGPNLFGRVQTPAPTLYEQGHFGTIPSGGMGSQFGGFGGAAGGLGGYGAPAGGGLQGGLFGSPSDRYGDTSFGPSGPAPSAQGGAPAPQEQFGPGDQNPNGRFDGMSGSDIFARLFGQRP